MDAVDDGKHTQAASARKRHTDAILESKSRKKIVVAGPGTGKTYLFKTILQSTTKNLTLTFINTLVEDLALELGGTSKVRTLHGFARKIMASSNQAGVKIYGDLPTVIREDSRILGHQEVNFEELFHEMNIEGENLQFYKKRKDYYGHYGFSDIIFAAVKYLDINRIRIPSFDQIVVDEFQDFNVLEVALIDLLAEKSPIVLTGDDDQALYDFKKASPDHIRKRHSDESPDFEAFNLPYCSRCTRVIVEAVNDIVTAATVSGHLQERIPKPYKYFDSIDKDAESKKYPTISYSSLQAKQIPWFIKKTIGEIAADQKKKFSVLIISPSGTHRRDIANALRTHGFTNVAYSERHGSNEPQLLDGLKILLEDGKCNLGWRIVSRFYVTDDEFVTALKQSTEDASKKFCDLIPLEERKKIRKLVALLRKVRDGKEIEQKDADILLETLDVDAKEIAIKNVKTNLIYSSRNTLDPAIRKIPIRTSTIQGSKGLAEDYVFITHFDDQYYLDTDAEKRKVVSDQSICKFLVAITRTRKKVYLISSNPKKEPTFLKWISDERLESEANASSRLSNP